MRLDQNLAAVMLLGLTAGMGAAADDLDDIRFKHHRGFRGDSYRMPKRITDGNRLHTERAPRGSQIEADRIAAAEAKRARKLAKRAGK